MCFAFIKTDFFTHYLAVYAEQYFSRFRSFNASNAFGKEALDWALPLSIYGSHHSLFSPPPRLMGGPVSSLTLRAVNTVVSWLVCAILRCADALRMRTPGFLLRRRRAHAQSFFCTWFLCALALFMRKMYFYMRISLIYAQLMFYCYFCLKFNILYIYLLF